MKNDDLKLRGMFASEKEKNDLIELMKTHGGLDADLDEDEDHCNTLQCIALSSFCYIAACILFS